MSDALTRSEMVDAAIIAMHDHMQGYRTPEDYRGFATVAVDAIIALGKFDVILDDLTGKYEVVKEKVTADQYARMQAENVVLQHTLRKIRGLALTKQFGGTGWYDVIQAVDDTFANLRLQNG